MKTLSKKLLSLLLVAVMLVAAMPFAAFADSSDSEGYKLILDVDGKPVYTKDNRPAIPAETVELISGGNATVESTLILKALGLDETYAGYTCTEVVKNPDAKLIRIELTSPAKPTEPSEPTEPVKPTEPKETTYAVTVTVDGKAVASGVGLVVKEGSAVNVDDAQSVLNALNLAYTYADYNSKSFDRNGTTITIAMADKKSTTPAAKVITVTLDDGTKTTSVNVTVGDYYAQYAQFNPAAQSGRTPVNLKIEYIVKDSDGKDVTKFRIAEVGAKTGENGKVQEGDVKVSIQWNSASRTINFYTDSTLQKVSSSKTVYYGNSIGELPAKIGTKTVEYWTVWGNKINENTTYSWDATSVAAVPHFAGENGKVYLEIYINGNRTSKYAQVDITHLLQNGVIYRDNLLGTIQSATKNSSLKLSSVSYLFEEADWSQYVRNVNNTTTKTNVQIGEDLQDARYIYVMVNGVTTKTTDPSNPKTGDSAKLGVAAAVLVVAVVGFGAVTVINKKKGAI